MSIRKRWYISLMQADSSKAFNFSVNKILGNTIMISVLVLLLVFGVSIFHVWKKNAELTQLTRLQRENELLRSRMVHFTTQMDSLLIKIKIMEDWEDTMRQERRLPVISPEVRALGSGGIPTRDPLFIAFDREVHDLYNDNLRKLDYVDKKIELTYITHFDLMSHIQTRESLFQSTPSILPTFGRVTSGFGYRIHPIFKTRTLHAGVDIANEIGTPIYATASGTVSFSGRSTSLGNLVRIDHASGFQTRYGHLSRLLVHAGETVYKGQVIGLMGNSGLSTGSHLHYEVMDMRRNRITDPVSFLNLTEDQITTNVVMGIRN